MGGVATNLQKLLDILRQKGDLNIEILDTSNKEPQELLSTITLWDMAVAIRSFFRLLGLIMRYPIRILHIQTNSDTAFYRDIVFAITGKLLGKKVILHFHGTIKGNFIPDTKIGKLHYRLIDWFSDYLLVLSPSLAEKLTQLIKSTPILSFANIAHVEPMERNTHKRLQLLFLGRLTRDKGFFDLLEAAQMLIEKGIAFDLHVGGLSNNEEEQQRIDQMMQAHQLSESVHLHGYLDGEDKYRCFSNADILILPSYTEKLPVTLIEALGYGLGIITTNVGFIGEYLKSGENCLFIQNDPKDIYTAVTHLADSTKLLKEMKERNRALFNTRFSATSLEDQLRTVYQGLQSDT